MAIVLAMISMANSDDHDDTTRGTSHADDADTSSNTQAMIIIATPFHKTAESLLLEAKDLDSESWTPIPMGAQAPQAATAEMGPPEYGPQAPKPKLQQLESENPSI